MELGYKALREREQMHMRSPTAVSKDGFARDMNTFMRGNPGDDVVKRVNKPAADLIKKYPDYNFPPKLENQAYERMRQNAYSELQGQRGVYKDEFNSARRKLDTEGDIPRRQDPFIAQGIFKSNVKKGPK